MTGSFSLQSKCSKGKPDDFTKKEKARSLSKEEEEVLWVAGKLGNNSPESLVNTIWWILAQYFGLRGRQEHHSMKVDEFALRKDDDGQEYVEFAEGLTKTRGGGLSKKSRDFSPKMFATGGERYGNRYHSK